MTQKKIYAKEFKIQAVKLGREIGLSKAVKEIESQHCQTNPQAKEA